MAPTQIRVPDLGRVEGAITFTAWLADEGARVGEGDEIAEVETSKVTFAIEAPASGTLARGAAPGDEVSIGQAIGSLG